LDGVTARSSWRLTASRKSGEPRGRPINSFSPERVELGIVRVGVEQIREIGDTVSQRLGADQGVVHAGDARAR
jgi:hypothetical protein